MPPRGIHIKPNERAKLLKYGKPLGKGINELITILTPGTFHRWLQEEKRGREKKTIGRPGKSVVLRELILKIARETGFGFTRILDELRKLGIPRGCRQNVKISSRKKVSGPGRSEVPAPGPSFAKLMRKHSGPAISLRNEL